MNNDNRVEGLGDKAVYRDKDSAYVSHSLLQTFYQSNLTKTEYEVIFYTLQVGKLVSPEELAKELDLTTQTVKKAIMPLKMSGLLAKVLDVGQWSTATPDEGNPVNGC